VIISDIESSVVAKASTKRAATADRPIQAFTVKVPQAAVDDLRRRLAATRWPTKELVEDPVAGRAARDDSGARPLISSKKGSRSSCWVRRSPR
jgi:Epoxide hydrolase N terminus